MPKRTERYATRKTIDGRGRLWVREVRARVRPRPHLALDPDRCALVVVDMLRYFAQPDGRCFLPAADAVIPNLERLLAAWRARGAPVAFTRHAHRGRGDLGMLGRFFDDYIRLGEPDAEIIDALAPQRGEPVFRKTTYDGFLGTRLEPFLRRRGATQVLVAGVLTHLCVETTARSAFCRGFEVQVPADATASSDETLHRAALAVLADGVAIVSTTAEILARFG